jgi:hypothetical protein
MTESDIDLIERALAISLPEAYRRGLCPFPIQSMTGNTDAEVWDDPHQLIALNQKARADVRGWPSWLFVIGQPDGDPSGYAIDTRSPECLVWWLDHMRLGPSGGATGGPFIDWLSRRLTDMPREKAGERSVLWFLLVWLSLSVALLVATWIWLVLASNRLRKRKA